MRRSVGRRCCGGWSCGGLEHDLHRPRDLDLTLNARLTGHLSCAPTDSIAMRRLLLGSWIPDRRKN